MHYSHYGRLCTIETPEGSKHWFDFYALRSCTRLMKWALSETPYHKVNNA
ncbi:MAG: hypothetical protein WKG06_00535 [Segetibacter sp.]